MTSYIPIDKVKQEGADLCWAAAIEMVYQHYHVPATNIPQADMVNLKNSWVTAYNILIPQSRRLPIKNSMESKQDYYLKLFTNSLLTNIGCKQYQIPVFLDINFIKTQIDANQAIIFSNIKYPLLTNFSAHAILISGYHEYDSVFWVLGLDPLNNFDGTFKCAWIYAEIKKYQDTCAFDFITDFGVSTPSALIQSSTTAPDLGKGYLPKEFSHVKDFIEQIISENCSMLNTLFGFNCGYSFNLYKSYQYRSISKINVLNNSWVSDGSRWQLLYLPVWQGGRFIFEMIFQEKIENKVTLIGMQETKEIQKNESLIVKSTGAQYILDHQSPNYKILCITPFNLLFYEIIYDNKELLAPINDYGDSLKKAILYTREEIREIITLL